MTVFRSACCEGEQCFCGAPADHKVEEAIFHDDPTGWMDFAGHRVAARHPRTAYICAAHFMQVMGLRALGSNPEKGV